MRCHIGYFLIISLLVLGQISFESYAQLANSPAQPMDSGGDTHSARQTISSQTPAISLDLLTCRRAVVSHRVRKDVSYHGDLPDGVQLSDKLGKSEFRLELDRQILARSGFDRFFPSGVGAFPLGDLSWQQGKLSLNGIMLQQNHRQFIEDLCYRLFPDKL